MAAVDIIDVKEPYAPYPGVVVPAASGDGASDDTAAIQGKIDHMNFWGDQRTLVFPPGRYRTTAKITHRARVVCRGIGYPFVAAEEIDTTTHAAVIHANHTGTAWEIDGPHCGLEGMVFSTATAAAQDVVSVYVAEGGTSSWIDRCAFWRRGRASLAVRAARCRVTNCVITTDPATTGPRGVLLPDGSPTGVGLWMQAAADGWVENCEISSTGPGMWVKDGTASSFIDLKLFNSSIGLLLWRAERCSFEALRVDENDHEGVVLDWGTSGNQFTGLVYSNGTRVAAPASRKVGLRIGSGSYNRFDMIFSNWDHPDVNKPGIDVMSPQQHGVWIEPLGTPSWTRLPPQHNRIEATYRGQRSAPIVDNGDATNKLYSIGDGIATPAAVQPAPAPEAQARSAGVAGPVAAAAAAGLLAFRNRRRGVPPPAVAPRRGSGGSGDPGGHLGA